MPSEGKLHYCDWKKQANGFRVWVRSRPQWSSTGSSFAEALENLADIVGAATQDGEPQFEFAAGQPDENALIDYRLLVSVYGNSTVTGPEKQEGLYEGGYCDHCGNPVGRRSRVPRQLHGSPAGDAGVDSLAGPVFSERFLSLLDSNDLKNLEFLEAQFSRKTKRRFFELIGHTVGEFVAKKDAPTNASQCRWCGWRIIYYTTDRWIRFIPADAVPATGCFAAGPSGFLALCMTRDRWQTLLASGHVINMRTDVIGLLPDDKIDKDPKLRYMQ